MTHLFRAVPLLLLVSACADVEENDHDHHDHEHEVMTTVVMTFTSLEDDSVVEYVWADPENDGSPVIDDVVLLDATTYDMSVSFLNELEDPAEDITPEIYDESDEHQVFLTGSAVQGPATGSNADAILEHAYADEDDDGLVVGLDNTITTLAVGSGELTVTLRHMPPESDQAVKVDGLAEDVAAGGFSAIGGANDVQVTFNTVVE
ncbi:MAG: type 1 periplasmic binding fold superfamily protein [Myxococcota bacterium]|nr:type 1 periplasmic binding fold superfamily protein [Myxococcota bacterium]